MARVPFITAAMQLTIILLLSDVSEAFFRHLCHGEVGMGRIDPIVTPNQVSQHVHGIHGAQNMALDVTTEDLLASNCTSCSIRQDKSVYWAPYLYFKHSNGTFQIVPKVGGMVVYYFTEKPADQPDSVIVAFPPGFRMIAGNTFKRTMYDGVASQQKPPNRKTWTQFDKEQQARAQMMVGFNCLHYSAGWNEDALTRPTWPDKPFLDAACTDGIRAELMFPSCWNGELDSPNHMDHVAYPTSARNGPCPPGFDKRLPAMFFETIYNTPMFRGLDGEFLFANGDPTGNGYHGDFISAWEDDVLQQAIDNSACTNGLSSGEQSACPVFDIKPEEEVVTCKMEIPETIQDERLDFVDTLPGKVAVASGPDWAPLPSQIANPESFPSSDESLNTSITTVSGTSSTEGGPVGSGTAIAPAPQSVSASSTVAASDPTSIPATGPSASSFTFIQPSPTAPPYPTNTTSANDAIAMPIPTTLVSTTNSHEMTTITSVSTDVSGAVVEWVILHGIETTTVYVDTAGRVVQSPISAPIATARPVKRHRHNHVRARI